MAARAHIAAIGAAVAACIASPSPPQANGFWLFLREPVMAAPAGTGPGARPTVGGARAELSCSASYVPDGEGYGLAFSAPPGAIGLLEARLSGEAIPQVAAGTRGVIEFPAGRPYTVEVEQAQPGGAESGGGLALALVDPPGLWASLAGISGDDDGQIHLDLPGAVAAAFSADGWRDAMRRVAECAP